MEGECYFDCKAKRIQNIIRCSKLYQDNIHKKLQPQLDSNSSLVLHATKYAQKSTFILRKMQM